MAWSLSYAFANLGKRGWHWRKIMGIADSYVRLKIDTLQQMEIKCEVLAYYFATKGALHSVFFPDGEKDYLAGFISRYGDSVLRLTGRSLLNISAAYHLGGITTSDDPSVDAKTRIQMVGSVYDCADNDLASWRDAASRSDVNIVAAMITLSVSDAFQVVLPGKQAILDCFRVLEIIRYTARSSLSGDGGLLQEGVEKWLR